ncbi:MAG: HAD family phosphatase [Actinomycetia bacterium]|nr:HAD family phosphatase [Actinomycetes bacterium]
MIRCVFFDLDGTLIDYVSVARAISYFGELAAYLRAGLGMEPSSSERLINAAIGAMFEAHPGLTNQEAFDAVYDAELADGSERAQYRELFVRFFDEVFPTLRSNERAADFNHEAISACRQHGLAVAVASQPIFCAAAITARIAWAGLADLQIPLASSSETAYTTKPQLDYYREIAAGMGFAPEECLMVGNEDQNDMTASQVGMRTFYVGDDFESSNANRWDGAGTLCDFIAELDDLLK